VVRAGAAGLAAALLLACAGAGGVEKSELPDAPLALLQRPEEQALRRLDALRDLGKRQGSGATGATGEGVVVLENLDGMFGGAPDLERRLAAFQGQLVLLDPRTGKTSRLENAPPQARPLAWSPDRRRLLVSGGWRSRRQLFAWERETGRVEIVTAGPGHHVNGCYAAGDRLVAVEVERESLAGAPSRLLASAPGGGALRALGPEAYHLAVACSPREPRIAFVRVDPEEGSPRLFVQALDPPEEPQEVAVGATPVFTPDGEWIVYVGRTTRGQRLYRVRFDGAGRTPLGAGVGEESHPAVSPDGRYVAYVVSDTSGRERVWVRRIDGTGDRPLLKSGDGSVPVW
jgi:Tol biopolymer transport system component